MAVTWFAAQNDSRAGYETQVANLGISYADPSWRVEVDTYMSQTTYSTFNFDGQLRRRWLLDGVVWIDWGTSTERLTNKNAQKMHDRTLRAGTADFDQAHTLTLQLQVRTQSSGGWSAWGSTRSINWTIARRPTGTPTAPGNPYAHTTTNNSIRVYLLSGPADWQGTTPSHYQIECIQTGQVLMNGATFTGLSPGTTYTFRGRGVGSGWDGTKYGTWSSSVNLSTDATVPGKPAAPTVSNVQPYQATVAKANPGAGGGTLLEWHVQLSTQANFSTVHSSGTYPVGSNSAARTGLSRLTTYYARVRFSNEAGWGAFSDATSFDTPAAAPSAPTGSIAQEVTATSAVITKGTVVDAGGLAITEMQVQYNTSPTDPGYAEPWKPWDNTPITGLDPDTTYHFRTRVRSSESLLSPWSSWASFSTPANIPDPVTEVTADTVADTTAEVSWTEPSELRGATILAYEVQASRSAQFTSTTFSALFTSGPVLVEDLIPGTEYHIRVRVQSDNGWTAWSASLQINTTGTQPSFANDPDGMTVGTSNGGIWQDGTWYSFANEVWTPHTIDELAG